MTRICVTGGRAFNDLGFVWSSLDAFNYTHGPISELGHGDADGVDNLCKLWAEYNDVPHVPYPADWDTHDLAAGTIRNGEMLDDFQPQYLLVFPGGRGTTNCAKQARKKGIKRMFFHLSDDPLEEAKKWG